MELQIKPTSGKSHKKPCMQTPKDWYKQTYRQTTQKHNASHKKWVEAYKSLRGKTAYNLLLVSSLVGCVVRHKMLIKHLHINRQWI